MLLNKLIAFIKRDFILESSYRLAFVLRLARIFATILTFFFISKLFNKGASVHLAKYGGEYFPFVLIGLAFSRYLTVSLQSVSQTIRREQMMGTLEAILATPTKVSTLIIGSSIWNFIFTSITVIIYLLLGVMFFGLDLSNMNLVSGLIILILTIISFSSIGIISAAFVLILKRGDPITWLIGVSFGLLGGVYYPVTIMPRFLQVVSYFLPITHSLRGLRMALLKGAGLKMLLPEIGIIFAFCILLLPISIALFKWALKKAKIDGSLVHY